MTQEEEICRRALFTYGFDAQAAMVSEECAELMLYVNIREEESLIVMS